MEEKNKFRIIAIRPTTYRRLKVLAAQRGQTLVHIAEEALTEYLKREEECETPSESQSQVTKN